MESLSLQEMGQLGDVTGNAACFVHRENPRSAPTSAACVVLAGTADGFDKDTAVSRAQLALDDYIQQYKAENHLGAVSVSAMRAEPQPYWRGRVSENMMYHPTS